MMKNISDQRSRSRLRLIVEHIQSFSARVWSMILAEVIENLKNPSVQLKRRAASITSEKNLKL